VGNTNTGYRRFLAAAEGDGFAIDPAKVEADAQFDGVFVLHLQPVHIGHAQVQQQTS
jgi:hypothetical protein